MLILHSRSCNIGGGHQKRERQVGTRDTTQRRRARRERVAVAPAHHLARNEAVDRAPERARRDRRGMRDFGCPRRRRRRWCGASARTVSCAAGIGRGGARAHAGCAPREPVHARRHARRRAVPGACRGATTARSRWRQPLGREASTDRGPLVADWQRSRSRFRSGSGAVVLSGGSSSPRRRRARHRAAVRVRAPRPHAARRREAGACCARPRRARAVAACRARRARPGAARARRRRRRCRRCAPRRGCAPAIAERPRLGRR